MTNEIQWEELGEVKRKANEASVSFELTYSESDNSFYISINSAADDENYISHQGSFELVVKDTIIWLDGLLKYKEA